MKTSIQNLYDSHVHLLFTGERAAMFDMTEFKGIEDLKKLGQKLHELWQKKDDLNPLAQHFRGNLFLGFGWNFSPPTRVQLDEIFPDQPVFFTRRDAHASLINTKAQELLKLPFQSSGLLQEQEHFSAYRHWPKLSMLELRTQLLCAQDVFLSSGFTHVRDMTMTEEAWTQLNSLSQSKEYTLATEAYIHIESFEMLDCGLESALRMREMQSKNLRLRGLKFFYDGTLGANTALLSCGCNSKNRIWQREELKQAFHKAWKENFEVAIHCIGDLATDEVVEIARELSAQGYLGRLCLEHVEVVRPETIQKMKPLHVEVYMQPCHYFSDRRFLRDLLGNNLKFAFPWSRFEKAKVPMFFGSDSPVEIPSFFSNQSAVMAVQNDLKIESIREPIEKYHSHPDKDWEPSISIFENEKLIQIEKA